MSSLNIFCFGFGQVAKTFIQKLKLENFNINLSATSRKKTHTLKFNNINYTSFQFEGDDYDIELIKNLEKSDHILVSIPPREGTDLVIKNFSNIIENCNAKWITYLSATSVYGDHKGEWVNEESKTKPITSNGIDRLSAEKLWLSLNLNKKIPLQIFRLSGIYSNESNILARLKSGKAKIVNRKNNFFQEFMLRILQIFYLSRYQNLNQEKFIIFLMINLLHQRKLYYTVLNYLIWISQK